MSETKEKKHEQYMLSNKIDQKVIILQKRDFSETEKDEFADHNDLCFFRFSAEGKKDIKELLEKYNCIIFDLRNKDILTYWSHSKKAVADMPVVEINKIGSKIPEDNLHGATIRKKNIVTGSKDRTQFLQRILADHMPSIPSAWKRFFGALAKLVCS